MDKDVISAKDYMDLPRILDDLMSMSRPKPQDQRLDEYCHYINMALSEFGQERCMVVGSTKEGTRLRTHNDQGDWDILVIGDITVPVECLNYRRDLPCFVHINGTFLKELGRKELIDGKFLPATLVKKPSPPLFCHLKGIFDICCSPQSFKVDGVPRVTMDTDIKPGTNVTDYTHWHSDLLNPRTSPRFACDKTLTEKVLKRLNQSEVFQDKGNGIAHFLQIFARLVNTCKTQEFSESYFYRLFGPLFAGFVVDQIGSSENNRKENESIPSTADSISDIRINKHEDHTREETTKLHIATLGSTRTLSTAQYETLPFIQIPASSKSVRVTYAQKSMKDFIPALRLSGPPIYIDQWTLRNRYWPNKNAVGAISRGQFFVVAKPAVKDEQPEIDFCLSCNIAEIILAKEMPPGHKKCLLMVKAFQRSILEEFSKVLTTFHWKTALYLMLESTDPVTYSESSEDVLNELRSLLTYMRDRLHEGYLQHYFFPSNLFAGLETCVRAEMVRKIEEIYLNPVWYLNAFLVQEAQEKEVIVTNVSFGKMMEMKKKTEKEIDNFCVDTLLDIFEGFGRPKSASKEGSAAKPNFPNLGLRIVESILADERSKRMDKENGTSEAEQTTSLIESIRSILTEVFLNKETNTASRTSDEEKMIENIVSFLSSDD
ncbi:uncharacterized protein LOC110446016 [Mizuhopecten yessoensis]|uniref:Mab-21-like HhH/H2TH-like domain-containing protein n=1 Tax=Mizuhopecten yessoensis TaxID=6573 RepID=A0A210QY88_MIZYE|nr:uncharacterized protein LOC110446016 [Mizuhopecten yessoensis]OWF53723.1 hypothetical protein KP79_PYT05745 [Mizuhopecten yessoensis]